MNKDLVKELEELKKLDSNGLVCLLGTDYKGSNFPLAVSERYLTEIIRDWYFLHTPEGSGTTVIWHSGFYNFVASYMQHYHENHYILSPENTLDLITNETEVLQQIHFVVDEKKQKFINLKNNYSMVITDTTQDLSKINSQTLHGLNAYSLPDALLNVSESYFTKKPYSAELALKMVTDPAMFFNHEYQQHSRKLGRIYSAYVHIGMSNFAKKIQGLADAFKVSLVKKNPFEESYESSIKEFSLTNPAAIRIEQKWNKYVSDLTGYMADFTVATDKDYIIGSIQEEFINDAYNSLSIEGYKITDEIIDAMSRDDDYSDTRDALAAKGYRGAFDYTVDNIREQFGSRDYDVLDHANQIKMKLFLPLVQAKKLEMKDITGYRDHAVYIKNAQHVPVSPSSLAACMKKFEDLLKTDVPAPIKAILAHVFLVYIHPYADGNGRTARFMMNEIFSSEGYPWLVVPVSKRPEYFAAIEAACSGDDILTFAKFITSKPALKHR